ncbi:precorrin-2 C(20)-methyltransferase [Reyranella sp. CPCC 100927]|uniref:precorrin-2 C(20)-methyltransferase n=1 Tax=Reyranella sp. CPCC 100927 TaxID=2599616 RepID=UPI0011B79030|nr:precorrin-2 C(20)-methyltransferase [Reyranella sp. CPCC 100927]TWT10902.1 precorrin-2 C(20)-methyltransferase [Reyranella sp. CPCC 100927]
MSQVGTLYGIGLGPGDPELMTLKAARLIEAAPVIAFFARRDREGNARVTAQGAIRAGTDEIRLEFPYTTEIAKDSATYGLAMAHFYDGAAFRIGTHLAAGRNVAVLCEGDPFLYGSFMYLFDRLHGRYPTEVVPGVTGMSGCWSRAGLPMTRDVDALTVVPATLDAERLQALLAATDAAVVMKIGRHIGKLRSVLSRLGRLDAAVYIERGTTTQERVVPFAHVEEAEVPYFSLVLLPAARRSP